VSTTRIDLSFTHAWQAEVLSARPAILPARNFVYPRDADEIERGALEVLIKPQTEDLSRNMPPVRHSGSGISQPFLATCALGFRDPAVPTGIWAAPNPQEICTVCGGYAYLIDTVDPQRFTMIEYRPVLEVRALTEERLLLFVGHRSLLAWGANGLAWETAKLSDEGVTITRIENGILHGIGWQMITDKEEPFAVDLNSGLQL